MKEITVNKLTAYRQFLTDSHKLANTLGLSDADAKHELLLELTTHRLNGWSDKQVSQAIAANDPTLSFKVTYARKELLRRHYKQLNNQQATTQAMQVATGESYSIITLEPGQRTDSDMDTALGMLLPNVFANTATRLWVESVLRVGKDETQARYHQNARQFNQKLNRVCRYAEQHRERTIGLMKTTRDDNELKELEVLQGWYDLLATEDTDDHELGEYIRNNRDTFTELVDTPAIKQQGTVLESYEFATRADQYTLANIAAERKAKLERYLSLH